MGQLLLCFHLYQKQKKYNRQYPIPKIQQLVQYGYFLHSRHWIGQLSIYCDIVTDLILISREKAGEVYQKKWIAKNMTFSILTQDSWDAGQIIAICVESSFCAISRKLLIESQSVTSSGFCLGSPDRCSGWAYTGPMQCTVKTLRCIAAPAMLAVNR